MKSHKVSWKSPCFAFDPHPTATPRQEIPGRSGTGVAGAGTMLGDASTRPVQAVQGPGVDDD